MQLCRYLSPRRAAAIWFVFASRTSSSSRRRHVAAVVESDAVLPPLLRHAILLARYAAMLLVTRRPPRPYRAVARVRAMLLFSVMLMIRIYSAQTRRHAARPPPFLQPASSFRFANLSITIYSAAANAPPDAQADASVPRPKIRRNSAPSPTARHGRCRYAPLPPRRRTRPIAPPARRRCHAFDARACCRDRSGSMFVEITCCRHMRARLPLMPPQSFAFSAAQAYAAERRPCCLREAHEDVIAFIAMPERCVIDAL